MTKLHDAMFWEHAPFGFACINVIFDEHQTPIDYEFIKINDKAAPLIGLRDKSAEGHHASAILPTLICDRLFLDYLGETARNGGIQVIEHFFISSQRWLRTKICAIEDHILYLYFEDITEYKAKIDEKERLLIEEMESYKRYIKRLPNAVFLGDKQGNILEANVKASSITGFSEKEITSMNLLDFVDPQYHTIVQRNFSKLKHKGAWHGSLSIKTKIGESRECSINTVKLGDSQFLAVVEDVTRRRAQERRLTSAHDILFNILKNMDIVVFISDANTHEVIFVNEYCKAHYGDMLHKKCWSYKGENGVCAGCDIKKMEEERGEPIELYSYEEQEEQRGKWLKWQVRAIQWIDGRVVHMHIALDITSLKETEVELSKRERTLQKIFDLLPVGLWIADEKGNLISNNPVAKKIWGSDALGNRGEYSKFKGRRLPSGERIDGEDWALAHTLNKGVTIENEMVEIETFDGQIKTILNFSSPIIDENNNIMGAVVANQEITELKAAEDSLQREKELMKITLESIAEGVIVSDEHGHITMVNQRICEISGYQLKDVRGKKHHDVFKTIDEKTGILCGDPVDRALKLHETITLSNHTVLIGKDGNKKAIAQSAAPIVNDKGETKGVVVVVRDVTEERRKKERILYLSYHDALTGLYNRRFFEEELNRLNTKRNLPLSIVMGDVNGLKLTNDAFGHDMGDMVLKKMAETIRKACREDDIIARWGGDEFILLLPRTNQQETERICRRINRLIQKVKMEAIEFSISFGYETKYHEKEDIKTIMKTAEDYMYRRKSVDSPNMRGNTIKTILRTLHEKTPREEFHSSRVSHLCQQIGKELNLSDNEIYELGIVGLMHDIGKIAISEKTLNKDGALTDSEWLEIRQHPEIGYRILSASNDMSYIADYVLSHHERLDGSGYPNQIRGHKIPLQSRILAVADAYDAMTSNRPYRKALPEDVAIRELMENVGRQFDREVVQAFVRTLDKGKFRREQAVEAQIT